MPPIRSYPAIKPLKTERSHEENQERAYIAASRRSDRSLEARIESARRASEIHKRRTGRALRVTESDVVNEEMYEEEDDDLPLKYRRLTAHLNGTASDFNRRLAAFVTNQVAMRSALDQAVSANSAAAQQPQQQPQQPPWSSASPASQPNVLQWMQQQQQQLLQAQSPSQSTPQQQFMPPMVSPDALHRAPNVNFRQAPYPSPAAGKSASPLNNQQQSGMHRRTSTPAHSHFTPTLSTQRSNSDSLVGTTQPADPASAHPTPKPSDQTQNGPWSAPPDRLSFSPSGLSTALPMDAQMFLGSPFNMADFNERAPNASDVKQPSYNFNPSALHVDGSKAMFEGMNQTLAPGAFENPYGSHTSWANDSELKLFDLDHGFDNTFSNTPSRQATPHGIDGQITPADDFAAFIDSSAYEETAT